MRTDKELTIGGRIRVALGRVGLTQAELARRLGTKRQLVNRWVNDDASPPGAESLALLSRELDVTEAWLRYGAGGETRPVSRETAERTGYNAGAMRGFVAGLRVAALSARPVTPEEAMELLAELDEDL